MKQKTVPSAAIFLNVNPEISLNASVLEQSLPLRKKHSLSIGTMTVYAGIAWKN
jgi:hypothetical protein